MSLILGVEEAGRGPVIGPMAMCGVLIEKSAEGKLVELGVKDSKLLSPRQREELAEQIKKIAKEFMIILVQPSEIDAAVESEVSNLNWLEANKFSEIINYLGADTVYVDCPSTNCAAYKEYLAERVKNKSTELVVEHKADLNYVVVSAASILAKVTRDKEIEKIKLKYKIEFGSGYPADPFTKQFLEKNYDKFPIFRKSWAPWKSAAKKSSQMKLSRF